MERELNSNELMIGDFVKTYHGYEIVSDIYTNSIFTKDGLWEGEEFEDGEFEPIPLTAEILENNGWHWNSIFMELDADANTQFSWANGCGAVLFKNGWHHCDCEYVHTLQHALRLCGFDELADNFKI